MTPIILIHGGAGDVPGERVPATISGVKESARIGHKILKNGGTALDAVEAAVRYMEEEEAFNADSNNPKGYGSVLNLDGEVEMDASIMNGSNLNAGAVAVVRDIAHPISLARLVMEKTPHLLLAGAGANRFAKEQGVPSVPSGSLVTKYAQKTLVEFQAKGCSGSTENGHNNPEEVGTVGAVAIDSNGHLAAATSTGGLSGKMVGRSGDTCIIGSGTYADDGTGAVSSTGHGETIAKYCLAHTIVKEIESGRSAQNATEKTLKKMTERLRNTAGAITISKKGEIGIYFTSKQMAWAYQKDNELHYGIEQKEDVTEIINKSD